VEPHEVDTIIRQHTAILEGLARLFAAQYETNQRQDAYNERLTVAVERLEGTQAQQHVFNADVRTTLARIETLLARMLPTGANGTEA
jgi:hypothetical protein